MCVLGMRVKLSGTSGFPNLQDHLSTQRKFSGRPIEREKNHAEHEGLGYVANKEFQGIREEY